MQCSQALGEDLHQAPLAALLPHAVPQQHRGYPSRDARQRPVRVDRGSSRDEEGQIGRVGKQGSEKEEGRGREGSDRERGA
eukprot:3270533-Rhodomonas_salina.1